MLELASKDKNDTDEDTTKPLRVQIVDIKIPLASAVNLTVQLAVGGILAALLFYAVISAI